MNDEGHYFLNYLKALDLNPTDTAALLKLLDISVRVRGGVGGIGQFLPLGTAEKLLVVELRVFDLPLPWYLQSISQRICRTSEACDLAGIETTECACVL